MHVLEADRGGFGVDLLVGGADRHGQRGDIAVELVLGGQIDDLLNAAERAERRVDRGDRAEELAERHDHHEQEENERDQVGDRDGVAGDPKTADAENHEKGHLHGDTGDRHDEGADLGDLDPHAPGAAGVFVDHGDFALGRIGGTHGANGADGTLNARGEVADLRLGCLARGADPSGQQGDGDHRHRDDEHGQAEQHRVDDEHRHEGADECERSADRFYQPLGEYRAQQGGVAADAGDQVSGATGVELADRQAQQPPHEFAATREHDALAGALQEVVLVSADQPRNNHEGDEQTNERPKRVTSLHDRDDLAHQQRLGQARGGAEHAQHDDDGEHLFVLEQVGQQLAELRAWPGGGGTAASAAWRLHSARESGCRGGFGHTGSGSHS